jgi:anaphase-promoting complex subunit 10
MSSSRVQGRRRPITFDKENEDAVLNGLASGIYDQGDVMALTNQRGFTTPVQPATGDSSDDEEISALPTHVLMGLQDEAAEMDSDSDYEEDGDEEMIGEDMEEDLDQDLGEGLPDEHTGADEDTVPEEEAQAAFFDPTSLGLKEINNLAHFGVSSHKPGNGVEELISDDLEKYWQ